jgi:alkanesulfonate monooxygenase SsuD/methylene tetrahydromethanopterin reductase-like flavin-dependent oxidoreductase (luciferase family)
MRFGIQLFPSYTAPELVSYTKRALSQYPFDTVWLPDHLSYENVFVCLAALLTRTEARVGTSVAHPFGRTPVDLAASFTALAHLAGDRGVTVGLGTGAATSNMILKQRRVPMLREMVLLLRELFTGHKAGFSDFPNLTEFFRLEPTAQTVLHLPPAKPPEIFVAAGGPATLRLAGELGDGLILSNFSFPTALIREGALEIALANVEEGRRRQTVARRFTKVLHLHVSIARDGAHAKRFSKRIASITLVKSRFQQERVRRLGFPADRAAAIEDAFNQGTNVNEMEPLIGDRLIDESGIVIAGTPQECIAQLDEVLRLAKPYKFDIVDMASPLGPELNEAIDLLCQEILPELQRRSDLYA